MKGIDYKINFKEYHNRYIINNKFENKVKENNEILYYFNQSFVDSIEEFEYEQRVLANRKYRDVVMTS